MAFYFKQKEDGSAELLAQGGGSETKSVKVTFLEGAAPVDVEVGRGSTSTAVSYIALRNASGTKCYIYPNTTGNAAVVSTTAP